MSPLASHLFATGHAMACTMQPSQDQAFDSLACVDAALYGITTGRTSLVPAFSMPAAACPLCGGWTAHGGMSQHAKSTVPVMGRPGCHCYGTGR